MDERGWTEYRLHKESGVPQSTLSNMFKRDTAPTIPTLESICKAFGLTLSQFFSSGDEAVELSPEQREMLDKWNALTSEQKKSLLQLLNNM
ncbi:MAG: transcriptional regulator [Clostridiales bacterium 43-6]|nr:MAG: transcriptional regulator [Clostridiales bacterium 43-6]